MVSRRIQETMAPPLVEMGNLARSTPDCISLGQGAPYYYPPRWVFEEMEETLASFTPHGYAPDPGIAELREVIASKLRVDNQIVASADNIVVTPGANLACFSSLLTITDPGDEVILLGPWYFNHAMDCQALSVKPVQIALNPDFSINQQYLEEAITERTKAIIFVNPANPTGVVYSKSDIELLIDIADQHDLWLLSDETYDYFVYQGAEHYSTAKLAGDRGEKIITINSFSKSFGIPGWRLGYYHGPDEFIQQSIKIQDTIPVCAPHPTQILGVTLMKNRTKIVPQFVKLMETNYKLSCDLLEEVSWLEATASGGAYYLFPRLTFSMDTFKLGRELITNHKVYLVPGDGFGLQGKNHFRISFANATEEQLQNAFSRLKQYP